ncbi:caspase-12-like [Pelmatolapia mariae]|uniref:caspase-12-like n=1 Tax=Pelmatolapia mariae TaxID=158779 RepID=UPI003211E98F
MTGQRLTEVLKQMMMEEEEDRVESTGSSFPSVTTDRSKGQPPDFSDEPTRLNMGMCTDDIDCNKIYPVTEHSISNRIALLINIRHFYDLKSNRHGAEYDAQAMLNLLYNLGYAVVYYQDLTAQEIDEALIRFSKHRKLFNTDSVFVVLMSHGDLGTIRGSDLKNFEIDKIYERLNTKNCPALMNKPKVIIIQACRGGDYHLTPIHDIEELFKKVMQQFEDFPSEQRQMPTKERDTLTKHFYLFPGSNLLGANG